MPATVFKVFMIGCDPCAMEQMRAPLTEVHSGALELRLLSWTDAAALENWVADAELVVLAMERSETTCWALLERIQTDSSQVPVIALVAEDDGGLGHEAVARGAADFLRRGEADPELVTRLVRHVLDSRALNQTRALFQASVENSPDLVCCFTPEGRLTVVNNAYCRYFGRRREDLLGRVFMPTVVQEEWPQVREVMEGLRPDMEPVGVVCRTLRHDGEPRWMDWVVCPVHDPEGRFLCYQTLGRDINELRAREDALRESEGRFRGAFDEAAVGMALIGVDDFRFVRANGALCQLLGYSEDQLRGRTFLDVTYPPDRDSSRERARQLVEGELTGASVLEKRYIGRDGTVIWAMTSTSLVNDSTGRPAYLVSQIQDVTAQRSTREALEESEENYRTLVENAHEGVVVIQEGRVRYANPRMARILGYGEDGLEGLFWQQVVGSSADAPGEGEPAGVGPDEMAVMAFQSRSGGTRWLEANFVDILWGESPARLGFMTDVTDRVEAERHLTYLSQHDALTGLPNLSLFLDRTEQVIRRTRWNERVAALLYLDLDGFQLFNEAHGHAVGDALLQAVAERLNDVLRQGDSVSRVAGDEFAILLTDMAGTEDIPPVAQKVLDTLQPAFEVDGNEFFLTASVGISVYPDVTETDDAQSLLRDAANASYLAKQSGRNTYQFSSRELNVRAFERLSLETDLRRALELDQFELHYQAQANLADGEVIGAEALLRWRHSTAGLMAPLRFIPALEETGLIIPVGEWILREACRQQRAWCEALGRPLRMAVNISAKQLRDPGFAAMVRQAVADTGIAPTDLELEITESCLVENPEQTAAMLRGLADEGIHIAIDDFGTGYSSLSYFRHFPVGTLKIDRSFVNDVTSDPSTVEIVRAIIGMGHSFRATVLAEGVESIGQWLYLRSLGCDRVQGFFLAKPASAEEFEEFIGDPRLLPAGSDKHAADARASLCG